jgi:hypothetical protein
MNFGQFRRASKSDITTYLVEDNSIVKTDDTKNIIQQVEFSDTTYACTLSYGNSYVLRFSAKSSALNNTSFNIKLISNENDSITQIVKPNLRTSYVQPFEVIITPNQTYDKIIFEVNRETYDFKNNKRKIEVSNVSLFIVNNLLDGIINTNHMPLKHIGVQGPKGMIMCINGEEIKIGNSGTYEIDNKIDINFFGVVVKEDSNKQPPAGGDKYQDFTLDNEY